MPGFPGRPARLDVPQRGFRYLADASHVALREMKRCADLAQRLWHVPFRVLIEQNTHPLAQVQLLFRCKERYRLSVAHLRQVEHGAEGLYTVFFTVSKDGVRPAETHYKSAT